nr:MAG TPA: hypothetical protein [Caudoviricetes sp.]
MQYSYNRIIPITHCYNYAPIISNKGVVLNVN